MLLFAKVTKVRKVHKTHNNDTHSSWNHGVLRPSLDRDVSAYLAMQASGEDEVTASAKAKQTVNTSCCHSEQMENIRTNSTPPRPGQIFPNHISASGIAGTSRLQHPTYLDAGAPRPHHPPPTLSCPTGCQEPPASNAKTKQPRTGKTRQKKTNAGHTIVSTTTHLHHIVTILITTRTVPFTGSCKCVDIPQTARHLQHVRVDGEPHQTTPLKSSFFRYTQQNTGQQCHDLMPQQMLHANGGEVTW